MGKRKSVSVTMRVRVGENELEITGPKEYVEKKIAEFLERQNLTPSVRIAKPPDNLATQGSTKTTKAMATAQFFKKVNPRSDVDRVLASGYYLEKFKNEEMFTAAEISATIRGAKTQPPKNPNHSVNQNIRKGYMMASGDKEGKMAFVLTTDGEEAIESLLSV